MSYTFCIVLQMSLSPERIWLHSSVTCQGKYTGEVHKQHALVSCLHMLYLGSKQKHRNAICSLVSMYVGQRMILRCFVSYYLWCERSTGVSRSVSNEIDILSLRLQYFDHNVQYLSSCMHIESGLVKILSINL